MSIAFVDTSVFVAILFSEPGSSKLARRLSEFDQVFASPLLEAELQATARREGVTIPESVLDGVQWVSPDRRLSGEVKRVLEGGYIRGADCWHLACAVYLFDGDSAVTFLTLDARQRAVAKALGFQV